MPTVAVTKMHGTCNDFVLVDQRRTQIADLPGFARTVCDRRGSVGADGVLAVLPSQIADARMRIFNADGSEAEMCGNGMRCVARYLSEGGEGECFRVETLAGVVTCDVLRKGPEYLVRLNIGVPELQPRPLPFADAAFVSLGNPHVVLFVPSLDAVDLPAAAQELQGSAVFPGGTNVHVAVKTGTHSLDVRHWERGVGLTYACGTGAVACAAAGIARAAVRSPVDVRVPGGLLRVEWDGKGPAYLTGPAARVFDTQIEVPDVRIL